MPSIRENNCRTCHPNLPRYGSKTCEKHSFGYNPDSIEQYLRSEKRGRAIEAFYSEKDRQEQYLRIEKRRKETKKNRWRRPFK